MTDVLGLAAILPASAGACCTVGAWRPGRAVDVVAAVVMVAAMVDGVVAPRVLPGVVWFVVLALLAVTLAAAHRLQVGPSTAWRRGAAPVHRVPSAHGRFGRLHAALGLLVMGAMGVGALGVGTTGGDGTGVGGHDVGMAGMHQHAGVVGVTWQVLLLGLTLGYLLLTAHILRDGVRHRGRALPLIETTAMGAAVAVMSIAML
ncbi:hypothetical protein DEJ28_00390 [Curtobacterium sp. MCPF17_002]|uniref:hypothetical protein n=1 Tax=Curtobacterium sp. MCPF17_002 TaxID=2175645 RepID=UPI0011B72FF5|nr:hypothetical protein [Curtobacterium sp. MCPF17_002]WIB77587.1 hypothetical protein DEJ28_00390 [Curtobacterium sp. MCPF17_002]